MKKSKKIISVILTMAILVGVLVCAPFSASAATLVWPVDGHTSLSRDFWGHDGQAIDISDSSINGATVRAAMGGTVTSIWLCPNNHYYDSNNNPSCCSGNGHGLVIHGDDGRYYNYAHMQAGSIPTNEVHYGARVTAGQVIGKVGSTGNSSGPHLHFLISTSSRWWETGFVNPQNETYTYSNPVTEQIVDYGNDFYGLLFNKANNRPIGQTNSGNVEVMDKTITNMNRLLWHFTKNSDGKSYRIQSLFNGKYLDVSGMGDSNGTNIQCYQYNDNPAQNWYFIKKGDFDAMRPVYSGRVVDMNNGDTTAGTNIHLWEWNGTNAQSFAPYNVTNDNLNLNYTITADKIEIDSNDKSNITVGGTLNYVFNYKFHIIDPEGNETVVDNGCNPTFIFETNTDGDYIIFAEIKNTHNTETGSKTNKSVTISVGCGHEYINKFVEAGKGETQGYVFHTCKKCGKTYKDNYMDYKEGWYYSESVPDIIDSKKYDIEYDNYYEKVQKDSPGSDWTKGETVKDEWVNSGGQYDSYSPLPTSDSRILAKECYYHWCIPGAGMGTEGNYEQTDKFNHYDEIALPNTSVHVTWTGEDNGHTVYTLAWNDGNAVYCKSGEQCDGSWGYHDYRCRAWYKKYVYQDRVKNELYKYTKYSGWTNQKDGNATKVSVRFKAKTQNIYGDTDGDGELTIKDATYIQIYLANLIGEDELNLDVADFDNDGDINVKDVTFIQMKLANLL